MYDNDFAPAAHFEMVKLMDWMNTPRPLFLFTLSELFCESLKEWCILFSLTPLLFCHNHKALFFSSTAVMHE